MYRVSRDDPLTKRLAFLGKDLREAFQAMLAEYGCTIPTWAVLSAAHQNPGLSQIQLAGQIGIEGPTLARHLDRLCAEALVERRRDEVDRRVVRIALTPAGESRWTELKHVAEAMEDRLTSYLSDKERRVLDTVIESIHRALEADHANVHTAS